MIRSKTTRNLLDKRHDETIRFDNPDLQRAVGAAEIRGCWLIYGLEKNGKTWLALMLAKSIAATQRVGYVSAEEGLDKSFKDAVIRSGITASDNILWDEYLSVEEIALKYSKPKAPRVVFVDNLTMYADELRPSELQKKLIGALPGRLLIFIAHEERREAYPALARMAKKMAKVIIHVSGLKAFVTSRFAAGGEITIDPEKATLCHGSENE